MKLRTMIAAVTVNLVVGASLVCASGELGNVDLSADMVMQMGGQKMEGKLYVSGTKTRMENIASIMIARPDLGVTWLIASGQNVYMEQPVNTDRIPKTARTMPGEIERTRLGTEMVDGRNAQKFKITYQEGERQASLYQWLVDGVPVPVKMEAVDGSWSVAYRNISVGPQPADLFESPQGYQKFAMPSLKDIMAQAAQGVQ